MSIRYTLSDVKSIFEGKGCRLISTKYEGSTQPLDYICKNGHSAKTTLASYNFGNGCRTCANENRKYSYEYVRHFFEENGCKLISTEYKNNMQILDYICQGGHTTKVRFSAFLNGQRCHKCKNDRQRLTFEHVQNFFEKEGCKLISTKYVDNSTSLEYICVCGRNSTIAFGNFRNGQRCKKCANDKLRFTYEYVKSFFEEQGCQLLSTEYVDCVTPLSYICDCKRESMITFTGFKGGARCRLCADEKLRFPYDVVKLEFENNGCKLLSTEYINSGEPLSYICECGREASITFSSFKSGVRCKQCQIEAKTLKYEDVKQYFSDHNCVLLSETYICNSIALSYKCECGNVADICFSDFQKGSRCAGCAIKRRDATNLKLYGVKNVFQVPEIRERAKDTIIEKYGADSAMRNEIFRKKSENTSLERYGVKYFSQSPEYIEKLNASMFMRHLYEERRWGKRMCIKDTNISHSNIYLRN